MCGPDYSQVNDKDVHAIEGDRFSELTDAVKFGAAHPQPVTVEDFSALKFEMGFAKMVLAADDIAVNHTGMWNEMAGQIQGAAATFRSALNGTFRDGGWKGATGQAAWNNLNSSLDTPNQIAAAASRMSVIVDGFSRGIHDTKKSFVENMDKYTQDLEAYPDQRSTIEHDYDSFARTVMSTIYTPVIDTVAANHPDTGSINPPTLGGAPGVPTSPGFTPGGGGAGGGMPPGAPGMPAMALPGGISPQGPSAPGKGMGDPTKGLTDVAKGAGDAAKGLGGMAGKGGGLANAAQQAMGSMGQALKGGAKPPGLPEGMLNLGPKGAKGLSAAGKGGGASGGRGGGAGAPKPATQSTSATPTKAAAAGPISKAGVSPQGSAGGAGAPAAGNRGAAVGGVHKANKALRNQRNGQDVIGEADAAVAVVGDEPKPPAAPKPGTA